MNVGGDEGVSEPDYNRLTQRQKSKFVMFFSMCIFQPNSHILITHFARHYHDLGYPILHYYDIYIHIHFSHKYDYFIFVINMTK